jgi:hypothetical protein
VDLLGRQVLPGRPHRATRRNQQRNQQRNQGGGAKKGGGSKKGGSKKGGSALAELLKKKEEAENGPAQAANSDGFATPEQYKDPDVIFLLMMI